MTSTLHPEYPANEARRGFDRRNLMKGAAVLAATAVSAKTASAETVAPLGQTAAPTRASSTRR